VDAGRGPHRPTAQVPRLENQRYFPYRWGQSFWAYLGGTYGDDIVGALLRAAGRSGNVQAALEQMTHRPATVSLPTGIVP